jgi:hypothetical protein
MSFSWVNRFNEVEKNGPFETQQAAKDDAVDVFRDQGGFAADVAILCDCCGGVVSDGHIKGGQWIEGVFPDDDEAAAQLAAAKRES